jgi:hypothetical protein
MANSERVPLETIRKRSERAVEYYKNCVVPAYHGRGNAGSPMKTQGHDSMENMNGIYTSQNGNTDKDKGTKGGVTFQDSSGSSKNTVKHNDSFTRGGHRATFHGTHSSKWKMGKSRSKEKSKSPESDSKSKRNSQGLSRSNSNLEIDIDFDDAADFHNSSMRRDYGSTSSLDVLSTSGDASFFAMIKDFGHRNLDQRSPAPAQMQEFLRGRIDSNKGRGDKFSNGSTTPDRGGGEEVDGSPRSKSMKIKSGKERKTRSKSITNDSRTGNILNKFRGKQEVEIGTKMTDSINSEIKAEERLRKKAFVHYDCQSLGFDIQSVINRKSNSNVSKNTSTGASAASGQVRSSMAGEKDTPDISTDTDDGDGKSNALVQSCPFFRNELGGEEERTISAGRHVAGKSSNRNNNIPPGMSAITSTRSPACCGLSILDSLPTPTGLILAHVVLHRGHVIEYVDHGASYYRHFFYGYGRCHELKHVTNIDLRKEFTENK